LAYCLRLAIDREKRNCATPHLNPLPASGERRTAAFRKIGI
jgi:hypothetical protein